MYFVVFSYIPITLHSIVMIAVAITMLIIPVTTAEVAASPTADALRLHCIPLRHPARATRIPKMQLWKMPIKKLLIPTEATVIL